MLTNSELLNNFHVGVNSTPPTWATKATDLKRLDRVRLSNGSVIIVTKLTGRPANCWAGVLENGHGKEYIFGPKHRPVKLGVVTEDHKALRQNAARKGEQQTENNGGLDDTARVIVGKLLDAVDAGNLGHAKAYVALLREAGL